MVTWVAFTSTVQQSLARAAAGVRMLIVPVDIATEFPCKRQIPALLSHGLRIPYPGTPRLQSLKQTQCTLSDLPAEHLFEHTYFVVGAHPRRVHQI